MSCLRVCFCSPVRRPVANQWPCNPAKTLIAHLPDERIIFSFGSGFGGNSLLGKKCLALRIGTHRARRGLAGRAHARTLQLHFTHTAHVSGRGVPCKFWSISTFWSLHSSISRCLYAEEQNIHTNFKSEHVYCQCSCWTYSAFWKEPSTSALIDLEEDT